MTSPLADDDRDDRDEELLREGRYAELVGAYYPIVVARLRMRLPAGEAFDVAHDAVVRLLSELRRGKRYPIRFGAVVHQIIGWTLAGYYTDKKHRPDTPLPPDWSGWERYAKRVDGGAASVAFDDWLRYLFRVLTPHDRQIAVMYFSEDIAIVEIARRLKLKRNAIDQALHRVRTTLRAEVQR